MSSRTRSTRRCRSASRASRPFSAKRHRVPELLERAPEEQPVDPVVVDDEEIAGLRATRRGHVEAPPARGRRGSYACGELVEPGSGALPGCPARAWSRAPGPAPPARRRPRRLAVGLERVGGPAERVEVGLGQGPPQRGDRAPGRPRRTCRSARRRTRRPSSAARRSNVGRSMRRSSARRVPPATGLTAPLGWRAGDAGVGRRRCGRPQARRAPRLRAPRAALQRGDQLLDPDRLRHVVVHAGRHAQLAVALHGVGRHGDDPRATRPGQRRLISREASNPSSSGICTSMRTTS